MVGGSSFLYWGGATRSATPASDLPIYRFSTCPTTGLKQHDQPSLVYSDHAQILFTQHNSNWQHILIPRVSSSAV